MSFSDDPFAVKVKKERKKTDLSFRLPTRDLSSRPVSRVRTVAVNTPGAEEVQTILAKLEQEHISDYISEFTHDYPGLSRTKTLGEIFPGKVPTYDKTVLGAFGAQIVTLTPAGGATDADPARKFILKRANPPSNLWDKNGFREVERRLKGTKDPDFTNQVRDVFIDHPKPLFNQEHPYYSAINREMLAQVVGAQVGSAVPNVVSIRCAEGYYSLHDFIENEGAMSEASSSVTLNLQSMQSVAILDIALFNIDRNSTNVLLQHSQSEGEMDLIPIDHAQTLQRDRSLTMPSEITRPCWADRPEANEPLTDASKLAILKLDMDTIVSAAEARGLVVGKEERTYMEENIQFLQSKVGGSSDLSLKEIFNDYLTIQPGDTDDFGF